MPWAIVPYRQRPNDVPGKPPVRYPAIDDWTPQIREVGGSWSETEILGNRCIVKVNAPAALLQQIMQAEPDFRRIPKDLLDEPLSDLTNQQKIALRSVIEESFGGEAYSREEWQEALGTDLGLLTVRQVLGFLTRRRRTPQWSGTEIVFTGPIRACRALSDVDQQVARP